MCCMADWKCFFHMHQGFINFFNLDLESNLPMPVHAWQWYKLQEWQPQVQLNTLMGAYVIGNVVWQSKRNIDFIKPKQTYHLN